MFSGIMAAISGNAALGWIVRRVFDWGGWMLTALGTILTLFANFDPATQAIIITVLQGNWQEMTLGSLVGLIPLAISQWRSWRATVKPQIVTAGKKRRILTETEALAFNNAATGLNQTSIPTR